MKILHMIDRKGRELYVIRTEDDILWFTEPWGVIKIAANVSSHPVETRVVNLDYLNTCDEIGTFNTLWDDTGSVEDIFDAFENLWAFADDI